MTTVHSKIIIKYYTSPHLLLIHFILLLLLTVYSAQVQYHSNFNISKISQTNVGDTVSLPIIITPTEHKGNLSPIHSPSVLPTTAASNNLIDQLDSRFKRYQLKDTNYKPEQRDLNSEEQSIIYSKQPPANVFDVSRTITIEDYQLLEIKNIRIIFINPTQKFTFCVNQIYMDSQALKRIQHRRLPLCLNPHNKYPFYFNFYITEQKPMIFRTSLYFIISIYDGTELVDEKIWPRQIIAKISPNHLRIIPLQIKNCNPKNFTTLIIPNPHHHDIKVSFENQFQPSQKNTQKQVLIPAQRNFKMSILSKQSLTGITTRAYQINLSDNRYPKLYLPVYCVKPLQIDSFNIGILNSDRSVVEILVPVSSNAKQTIQIKSINVQSTSSTIEVLPLGRATDEKILSGQQHIGICRLIVHLSKEINQKTVIEVKIRYVLQSNPKQILQAKNKFKFYEVRNPLSLNGRRFIDVTKPQQKDPILNNIFPIRNNLNLPLLLIRVIFDQKIFKMTWLKDRREYIYPNQMREDFSLQYIGQRQLKISPVKYVIILQFNGNLFIPIQIFVYDHSLQCAYNNVQQKCQNLPNIDYGYYRNNSIKFRQLILRNWNPVQKQIKIKLFQNMIQMYGMNCTINIYGPFPTYQIMSKHTRNTLYFYLKGNHFIIINIAIAPLKNCTSGQATFQISTENQVVTKKIKFKVENGTIALIPQILRISSAYEQTVEYLNLVSTFSQPYKIKNTFVNSSNINIFFNNHSQIYQNQWIGLALVYDPFQLSSSSTTFSYAGSTQTVHSTQSTSTVTSISKQYDVCCGNQFFINSFINSLYSSEYKRFTYVSVRVVTTTQLQTNSTIIIDNKPPKMIKQQNLSISLINYNKNTNQNSNSNHSKDYIIKVKNVFKDCVKYRPIIVPVCLYEDTKQFVSTMRRVRKTYEDALFCVNNAIAVKHNFSPQMVKTLLSLDSVPHQITIEPLQNQEYYFTSSTSSNSHKKNSFDTNSSYLTAYVRKTVANGARVCYKMNITKYLKQLIETHIFNDIAQSYSSEIFHQFVEKQMEFLHTFLQYLEYDEFYDNLDINFEKYCNKSVYTLFRFCKQIGVTTSPSSEVLLEPGAQSQIALKASTKFQQTSQSFYLVLLNNITKYQAHFAQVTITQPKLKIIKAFNLISSTQNSQIKQPQKSLVQSIKKSFTKKQLLKLTKIKQSQLVESDVALRKSLSSVLPIILTTSEFPQPTKQTQQSLINRTFTIYNSGTIDVNISHIGFQNVQNICQDQDETQIGKYDGFIIDKQLCKGFMIKIGEQKNLTISLTKEMGMRGELNNYWMYLYSWKNYYFRMQVVVKGMDVMNGASIKATAVNFILAFMSFLYVVLVIFKLKKQVDHKQQQKKQAKKFKIMSPSNYSTLGTRIEKKGRRLQPIPQDQISIVKQIQQSRIKQFFNSSDQSQIANRHHTEEEQPSNIQILNALKNDKNNISLSEQSSIDFIDLNTLNKSNQYVEYVLHEQNESEQQGDSGKQEESGDNEEKQRDKQKAENEDSYGNDSDEVDSNFSQAEGDVVDYSKLNEDYGWGDPSQQRKKEQESTSYYNVFFSQNPLKKKNQNTGIFHWMNDYQRPHYR